MEAFKQEFQDRLYFIEYQDLVKKPEKTMKGIYEFLGEKYYEHDFNSLENQNRERDIITYGLSDMHEVRPELKSTAPDPKDILPEEIITKCEGTEFWRQTKSNINIIK
jgi:sulfotransferase